MEVNEHTPMSYKVWYKEGRNAPQLIAKKLTKIEADYLVNSMSKRKREHGLKGQYVTTAEVRK